jgi:hypothetical protein
MPDQDVRTSLHANKKEVLPFENICGEKALIALCIQYGSAL